MGEEVRLFAFIGGYIKQAKELMFKDWETGMFSLPIPFFVVKHGSSFVAIDTGMSRQVAVDHVAHWGEMLAGMFTPTMTVDDTFRAQVKSKLGLAPGDFAAVILTHGHLDHSGDIGAFAGTKVPIYVQKPEHDLLKEAAGNGVLGYIKDDLKEIARLNIKPIDGVLDLFGDGTVVAFPMPGHTPGMQAVLVRTGDRTFAVMSDVCNTIEQVDKLLQPAVAGDPGQCQQALHVARLLRIMGAEIIPMHDIGYWANKPLAPESFR